ncbi:MAG: hypothetical protein ACYDAA_15950 [Syntrophales bacterium]
MMDAQESSKFSLLMWCPVLVHAVRAGEILDRRFFPFQRKNLPALKWFAVNMAAAVHLPHRGRPNIPALLHPGNQNRRKDGSPVDAWYCAPATASA